MQSADSHTDTIVAVATGPAPGGIGVVRLSGPRAQAIGEALCARALPLRQAVHVAVRTPAMEQVEATSDTRETISATRASGPGEDAAGSADQCSIAVIDRRMAGEKITTTPLSTQRKESPIIDDGIALRFAAPASFTGEDVVELQLHGSPVVLQQVVDACVQLGARRARPGEFSERAWHHGKLDLAQAEAIADLIAARDLQAARAARRSLDGVFSRQVDALAAQLLHLRVHVEATIDFADEPIETLGGDAVAQGLDKAAATLALLLAEAERGRRLRDGLHGVLVGLPNAGKSSLLNALAGSERAIVTDIPGTTRDLLQETVRIGGVELTLVDTAGQREGGDAIEREGMRRGRDELARADLALVVLDAREAEAHIAALQPLLRDVPQLLWLHNKSDLLPPQAQTPSPQATTAGTHLQVSARSGAGLDALRARLGDLAGAGSGEGAFSARARHVDALGIAQIALTSAINAWRHAQAELAAEDLRQAHDALGEITGRTTADALLGHIFANFCIGK